MIRILIVILVVFAGCSFLTPGLDTRTAAESKSSTSWDKDSNLQIHDETTHNRRTVAAESAREDGLEMEYYPDGSPKTVKGASHHLSQWSEPKDVMDAYAKLAEENAKVAAALLQTINSVMAMVQPILMERYKSSGSFPSESEPLWKDIVGIIQQELDKRLPAPVTTQPATSQPTTQRPTAEEVMAILRRQFEGR